MSEITVFISYSHDSDDHRDRVLGLSERLRADGIATILDHYVERGSPTEGWPRWMMNGLNAATHVVCVCTETYRRRFLGQEVPSNGKGLDWEGALITQALYDARSHTNKFIPVLFERADESHVPEPFRSQTHYVLDSEESYQALYDALLNQAGVEPGPIGPLKPKPRATAQPANFGVSPSASLPAASSPSPTALSVWSEKLEFLLVEHAVCVDPDMKFRLKHLITEAQDNIRLLEGTSTPLPGDSVPPSPRGSDVDVPRARQAFKERYKPVRHDRVVQLAWSRKGSKLASASLDGTVRVWDLKDDQYTCTDVVFGGGSAVGVGISCLAWAHRDTKIFAGTTNGLLASSELRSRRPTPVKIGELHMWSGQASESSADWITCLAVSPNGDLLASGSEDQNVRIWSVQGMEPALEAVLDGPSGDVLALAWSSDGKVLFCGDSNGSLLRWNQSELSDPPLATDPVFTWDEPEIVEHIAFAPDGRTVGMVSWNKQIRIGRVDSSHNIVFEAAFDVPCQPLCLSFSGDGQFFASLSIDGKITLWKTEPCQRVSELELGVELSASRPHALAYHPAKPLLASPGRQAKEIRFWNMEIEADDSKN